MIRRPLTRSSHDADRVALAGPADRQAFAPCRAGSFLLPRGSEAASRLAHTQESAGASPAPATSFLNTPRERRAVRHGSRGLLHPLGAAGFGLPQGRKSAARKAERAGRACHRVPSRCLGPP